MKKVLLVLFMFCLVLCGCGKQEKEENNANVQWDCVEYTTIEEMNKAAGTNIVSAAFAGKADESFCVISGNIAQYTFTCNDEKWCIRASKDVDNDISGLYYENIGFEKDLEATYYNDHVYAHRFFYDDVQYMISLDVENKDIAMSHFDEISAEFQTNITGVQAGYKNELVEDGDNVIFRSTRYNSDGTATIMETIYGFNNDKMVSIISKIIFESEEAAKEYYDLLIKESSSADDLVLDGVTISSEKNGNLDFYQDYTKDEFISMMKSSLEQ